MFYFFIWLSCLFLLLIFFLRRLMNSAKFLLHIRKTISVKSSLKLIAIFSFKMVSFGLVAGFIIYFLMNWFLVFRTDHLSIQSTFSRSHNARWKYPFDIEKSRYLGEKHTFCSRINSHLSWWSFVWFFFFFELNCLKCANNFNG